MTNMEFYRDKIELINNNDNSGVALLNGEPVDCTCIECNRCEFPRTKACSVARTIWLMEEHIEKPKLSEVEIAFLKAWNIECWVARDADGTLYVYSDEPHKYEHGWAASDFCSVAITSRFYSDVHFDFITWESNRAWSVKELLQLKVK